MIEVVVVVVVASIGRPVAGRRHHLKFKTSFTENTCLTFGAVVLKRLAFEMDAIEVSSAVGDQILPVNGC